MPHMLGLDISFQSKKGRTAVVVVDLLQEELAWREMARAGDDVTG